MSEKNEERASGGRVKKRWFGAGPPCGINSGLLQHGSKRCEMYISGVQELSPFSSSKASIFGAHKIGLQDSGKIAEQKDHWQKKEKFSCTSEQMPPVPRGKKSEAHQSVFKPKISKVDTPRRRRRKRRLSNIIAADNSAKQTTSSSNKPTSPDDSSSSKRSNDANNVSKRPTKPIKILPEPPKTLDRNRDEHEECEVKSVLGHEMSDSGPLFFIEWESGEITTEPCDHVVHLLPSLYGSQW
eukprot:CAMPEP_0197531726 /NCGR_PEP_ID=MMETSP1318-20131121/36817_1 /TAXON_ID=552666 /ORGANISM="Partenskyella glossopodia, Strain RCC365" /LENGTH=240 /DNA_ID=CAMNT_0043088035 /DNA_START=89 /DNA_END=808 /DNA_ORIENTATION=-